jgi:3-hydroxyacyl-CoA dehydrogenase
VAGRNAVATIKGQLTNMRDGGFISAHDFHIATLIAEVVCGGDVDAGSLVSEEYLMTMERERFCALLDHPKTRNASWACFKRASPCGIDPSMSEARTGASPSERAGVRARALRANAADAER